MLNKIGIAVGTALITVSSAWAGPQLESLKSNCAVINCSGMTIRGAHVDDNPFVVQVFARVNECLRLDVKSQSQDTAMLLSAPTVNLAEVNDDRDFAGGDFRPLILVDPVPQTGWYTVIISYWDSEDVDTRFVLDYGRYGTGNPNCAVPVAAESGPQLQRQGSNPLKKLKPATGATDGMGQDE